jgi:hypothetical protein
MDSNDQKRTGFRYALSIYQAEYSQNFLFECGRDLDEVFEGLIDRSRATLHIKTTKTILDCKRRPQQLSKTRWEVSTASSNIARRYLAGNTRWYSKTVTS